MKRLLICALLLCLGLTGCGRGAAEAGAESESAGTLPAEKTELSVPSGGESAEPVPPETLLYSAPGEASAEPVPYETAVRSAPGEGADETPSLVELSDGSCRVRGPAGTVNVRRYLGSTGQDPVWVDLDGDGQRELLFWGCGPTSGLFTVALFAYGLEEGRPLLKGSAIYNLPWGEVGLEPEDGAAFLRLWNARLPVSLEDGALLLNGGELPEDLLLWAGGTDPAAYGAAFAALKQRVGDWALLNRGDCLIWQEQGEDAGRETWAAVSENGVTVTGLLRYTLQEDGSPLCLPEGLGPIAPVEDPTVFLELSPDALAERLGPCHFNMDLGGVSVPCWFTEDGKLLVLRVLEQVEDAGLRELCVEALPGEESLSEADAITVHLEQIPTQISAPARWERFLAACERGEPDRVKLHLSYAEGAFDLLLDYDGSLYRMTDESGTRTYQHLIVSREDEPPATAAFRHAVHYLLSDDADMTHQRWFSCMVSSAMIPDFPPTAAIFTVYEP